MANAMTQPTRKPPAAGSRPKRADLSPLPARELPADADADALLARRAAAGDLGAFDALVTLYSARVFSVAFRMLQDRAEAEDLAQEVFLAVYKALPQFRGESKLSTWIYRITKNRCLNRIQFLGRRKVGRLHDIDDPAVAKACVDERTMKGAGRDPTRRIEQGEARAVLEAALGTLSVEHRTLVTLRDLEGLTYDEIVEVTGLPLGTIKSRLHRARSILANSLRPLLGTPPTGDGGVP